MTRGRNLNLRQQHALAPCYPNLEWVSVLVDVGMSVDVGVGGGHRL